ncbi:hypothetical protein BT93_D0558 [Corymbia citriodora subsp. variegata]|nr:hypothetical protein BT93_D0558 [Corymbia citriodora subsp. variegata]KAF8031394.1 hypothetical protein BT93_D0558 [Corymbia citriodora subsp. variegata]
MEEQRLQSLVRSGDYGEGYFLGAEVPEDDPNAQKPQTSGLLRIAFLQSLTMIVSSSACQRVRQKKILPSRLSSTQ